jgi:hypothetical protein
MHGHMLRYTVTCYDAWSHVTMHGHMLRCTVTCYDARSHFTMYGHMLRCTVKCYDARSHVTMHGHMNLNFLLAILRTHLKNLASSHMSRRDRIETEDVFWLMSVHCIRMASFLLPLDVLGSIYTAQYTLLTKNLNFSMQRKGKFLRPW